MTIVPYTSKWKMWNVCNSTSHGRWNRCEINMKSNRSECEIYVDYACCMFCTFFAFETNLIKHTVSHDNCLNLTVRRPCRPELRFSRGIGNSRNAGSPKYKTKLRRVLWQAQGFSQITTDTRRVPNKQLLCQIMNYTNRVVVIILIHVSTYFQWFSYVFHLHRAPHRQAPVECL